MIRSNSLDVKRQADALIEATPDFEHGGGKVTAPEGNLRDLTVEQVAPNMVIFHDPKGNFFKSPGWTMIYFMDTEQAAADMKANKIDYPMFIPGTMSMRWNGYAMIDAIWKKRKGPRGETPEQREQREAMKHVVGALEAYVTDEGIFVDNLSVRPGWRRNTMGAKLMQALKNHWPGLEVTHSQETEQGGKFLKATGQYNPYREKAKQPAPVQPEVREKEPAMEALVGSVLVTLLEGDDADEWIGVDLDGTLAKYDGWKGSTKIGEPIPAMVNRIRRWVGHGKKVKIFTARADDEKSVNAIKKWLKTNELPDLEVTNLKDEHMKELWDDRAVSVEKNTGKIKEAEDQPWGPNWQPQPHMVAWFAQLLRVMKDGAVWAAPGSQQVYKIDHQAKTFTLMSGNPNDPNHWHDKNKKTLPHLGYTVLDAPPPPPRPDEQAFAEAIIEELLMESPTIATLEKNRIDLEPEERQQIMKAKAVWPFGKNGADSPAIHKATVKGKTWFWSNTHRCGQVRPTLKGAIKAFHDIVEPSA
jgi:hypothetical protein